jgi:triosephosphate isomerase
MPQKIFAGNWKLNKSPKEARAFVVDLIQKRKSAASLVIFPSAMCLEAVAENAKAAGLQFGLQNAYFESKGAFTGENSAAVSKELGATYVLIGHSERRTLFKETDEMINKKVKSALSLNLIPMICIGETLAERESDRTIEVLEHQISEALKSVPVDAKFVVAYEPVWAIGTGKVASFEQVTEAHHQIFKKLKFLGYSEETPILYGGSVKPDNSKQLLGIPHVDGFLIGGASLEVDSFLAIAEG